MKSIFVTMMVAVAGMSLSCQVQAPLDPLTMKPSCKCCPKNHQMGYVTSCSQCDSGVIVGPK